MSVYKIECVRVCGMRLFWGGRKNGKDVMWENVLSFFIFLRGRKEEGDVACFRER